MLVLDEVRKREIVQIRTILFQQLHAGVHDIQRQVARVLRRLWSANPRLNVSDAVYLERAAARFLG